MPLAFTDQQMDEIRQKLFDSACRYAVETGVRKTSMDMLAQDAGISKSTFYKFFESKEILFLKVAQYFEKLVLAEMKQSLKRTSGLSGKERTAAAVNAAFVKFARLGAIRFFREDLPMLAAVIPQELARNHMKGMAEVIVDVLEAEQICFAQPREIVLNVIQLLYHTIPAVVEMDHFIDAFQVLVLGACNQVVA